MPGDHSRRPPPPYSPLPHKNNAPNDGSGSIQTNISNERSPLFASPPATVHHNYITTVVVPGLLRFILFVCMSFIIFSSLSQIGANERDPIKEQDPIREPDPVKERDSQRHEAGVMWRSPVKGSCVQYALRSHSATLLNYVTDKYWVEACEMTQMIIRDREMKSPLKCELVDNEVIGHWHVDDGGCRPYFSVENEECVGSDKIITARLMYIQNDTQWEDVCMTTPFHSSEKTYMPISCQNKGVDGILGYVQMVRNQECMKEERVQHRHEAGVSWDTPQPKSCLRSGVSEYSTVLLNYRPDEYWKEACETTELEFNGQELMPPDRCEKFWDGNRRPVTAVVVAYWSISNVNECTPFWGSISRDHCVGTNKRMVSARLWNIRDAHLWDIMCATTALTLQNMPRVPLSCENKGLFGGIWGHWEIYDDSCNMLHED